MKRAQSNLPAKLADLAQFVLVGREKLTAVRAQIRAIDKLPIASGVREQKRGEAQMLAEALLDAEVRIGELTREIPESKGRRTDLPTAVSQGSTKSATIAALGLHEKQVERFERMAEHPDVVEQVKADARDNDDLATRSDVLRRIKDKDREEVREDNRKMVERTEPFPTDTAAVTTVIDPPWDWGDEGDVSQFGRGDPTYHTMSLEELLALDVAASVAKDAHLYLWITNRSLPKGFALMERWGFRYVTCLTWCKPSIGMGNYFRGSTEQVLFGVRGSLPLLRNDVGTWFNAKRGDKHSAKPDAFYDMVESCSPGPWRELFARKQRRGWLPAWGAEA